MDRQEVEAFYATITAPLFTAIRDAARAVVPRYDGRGLHLHDTGQDKEGRALATGSVVITREGPNDSMWTLALGFDNAQGFYDAINLDVPKSQFPPMLVPIEVSWLGNNHWGRRQNQSVDVPPLELTRDSISWLGRRWPNVSDVDAEWIVKTLLEQWLLHDSPDAAEEAHRQVPGARWERIEPRIAGWGQAEVWRVRDLEDPAAPHRAMKVLRWRKGPGTTAYKRLLREIEITRQLGQEHPGIVEVIDYGIPQDGDEWTPFYVMPLADTTLSKATDFAGNLEAVLNLGIKLATALGVAHQRGVIHRDVKPDNVLLFGPERRPVLADFGICFLETDEGQRLTGSEANTVGPANYVAPELLGGKADSAAIDPRVDVYSLGKTLYYALAGGEDLPREYYTQDRYDLRRRFDDPRMAHFYGLLERMVVEDPARRFPTMHACADALTRALTNIKKSVPYATGMYGGVLTPVERAEQLTRLLGVASGLPRKDGIREAIADSRKEAENLAELGAPGGRPAGRDALVRLATEAAESFMAVGLPLVAAGDSEGFERWLDEVVAPLMPDGTGGMSDASNVRRAASVLAFHGVAVAAWQLERFAFLAAMLKKYDEHESAFIHLRIFNGEATASWQWIGEALKGSAVLRRARPALETDLDAALVNVAGLGALLSLLNTKPEVLAAAVPERGDLNIVLFPAFMPQACGWLESLPALFMRTPALERAVAEEVFGTTGASLRTSCKTLTPKLRRILAWTASQLGRASSWIGEIPHGGAWSKWSGAEVPSPLGRR